MVGLLLKRVRSLPLAFAGSAHPLRSDFGCRIGLALARGTGRSVWAPVPSPGPSGLARFPWLPGLLLAPRGDRARACTLGTGKHKPRGAEPKPATKSGLRHTRRPSHAQSASWPSAEFAQIKSAETSLLLANEQMGENKLLLLQVTEF